MLVLLYMYLLYYKCGIFLALLLVPFVFLYVFFLFNFCLVARFGGGLLIVLD